MEVINRIAQFWSGEILKGAPAVPLSRLREVTMPERLLAELTDLAQAALYEEVNRICSNPAFSAQHEGADEFRDQLLSLLAGRLSISQTHLSSIVEQVFQKTVEKWRGEPLSFRKAAEDPVAFAREIMERCRYIIPAGENGPGACPSDVIAIVCEASGLKTLADAVDIEAELGADGLTTDELTLLMTRLNLLRQRYSVGRRMAAFEGGARTLAEEESPEEATEPVLTPVAEPSAPAPEPHEPASPESVPKAAPRPGFSPTGEALYNALMADDNLAYFSELLFGKDTVAYQRLAYHISRQKKLSSALTLADNELFVREIPSSSPAAVRLLTLIRQHFRAAEDDKSGTEPGS